MEGNTLMHRKRFSALRGGLLGALRGRMLAITAICMSAIAIGGAAVAATSNTGCVSAKDGTHVVHAFTSCPTGYYSANLAGGTYAVAPPAASPVKIVHKTVIVDATFQTGSTVDRTITLTGLPGYTSGGYEVRGDNTVDLPAGLAVDIHPAAGTTGTTTVGATTRQFVLTPTGFVGTKSFVLDLWVLAVAP